MIGQKKKITINLFQGDKNMTTDYHDFTTKDMSLEERRKIHVGDIWINAVKCKKCGEVIRSKNRHDFRWCSCKSVAVDGGSWYTKRVFTEPNCYEELSESFDDIPKEEDDE